MSTSEVPEATPMVGEAANGVGDEQAPYTNGHVTSGSDAATNGELAVGDVPAPTAIASPSKPRASISDGVKGGLKKPIDTGAAKSAYASGPRTPTVQKILSSGKFGGPGISKMQLSPPKPTTAPSTVTAKAAPPPPSPTKASETLTGSGSAVVPEEAPSAPVDDATTLDLTDAAAAQADGETEGSGESEKLSEDSAPATVEKPAGAAPAKSIKPPSAARRTSTMPPPAAKPTAKPGPATSATSSKAAPGPRQSIAAGSRPPVTSAAAKLSQSISGPLRKAVISPTPSTASAKAAAGPSKAGPSSLTEKKATVSSTADKKPAGRPSVAPVPSKPASSSRITGAKAATASVSSVKEIVKSDPELERKYQEALAEVTEKTERIAAVETELEALRTGLDAKVAEVSERTTELEGLRTSIDAAAEARQRLEAEVQRLEGESKSIESTHRSRFLQANTELSAARAELASSVASATTLKESHSALEASLTQAKEELKTLTASHGDDAAAAAVERAALAKAQEDLKAIKAEAEALNVAHARAISDYEQSIAGLKSHVGVAEGSAESLRAEVDTLRREREETSQKVSELEVEILELKEAEEKAHDDHVKQVKALEIKHEADVAALQKASEDSIAAIRATHDATAKEFEEMTAAERAKHLEAMEAAVKAAEEQTHAAGVKAQEALAASHAEALWEKEVETLQKIEAIEKRAAELQKELESQESQYNTKVDAVKDEHQEKLKKVFSDAKIEAGNVHAQELAVFREQSKRTVDLLKEGHKTEIESLNSTHNDKLAAETKASEKQISQLKLELGATQEDLAKAKGGLATALAEVESLKAKVDQAAKDLEQTKTALNAEKDTALADLAKRLANTQREMSDLSDTFKSTQAGYSDELEQIKKNHQKELEEASKGRVQALDELQKSHDGSLGALKTEIAQLKSDLDDEKEANQRLQAECTDLKTRSPPPAPKAQVIGDTVPKEELAKLHQAHEARLAEMESDFKKRLQALSDEKDTITTDNAKLKADMERLEMEKNMYEADANEQETENAGLKAELESLRKEAA